MNKLKLKHARTVYKQQGRPICAIYALLNDLVVENPDKCSYKKIKNTQCTIDDIAKKLWEWSIDSKNSFDNLKSNEIECNNLHYSLVGEFMSSKQLCNFINSNKEKINNKIKKFYSKERSNNYNIITNATPVCYNYFINNVSSQITNNDFYIMPINTKYRVSKYQKNMCHWICIKAIRGTDFILNSNISAEKHTKIFSCIKIYNFQQLKKAYYNMTLLSGKDFDVQRWAKHKYKHLNCQLPENADSNIKQLSNRKYFSCNHIKIKYNATSNTDGAVMDLVKVQVQAN